MCLGHLVINLKEKSIYVQDGTVFVDFPHPAFSPGRRIK
jgi:hypothetical protein